MKAVLPNEVEEILNAVHYHPAVSVIMPFEPKMSAKTELQSQLKFVLDKVERELMKDYNDDLAGLVLRKLKEIIKNLNFNTYKKSIALFVSPVFEKVFYLDIEVQEKIIIDESFEIRDLIYAKKDMRRYMILVLSGKKSKAYLHYTSSLVKVKSNVPDHIAAFENNLPERTGNFSDPSQHKEVLLKKFLLESDHGLTYLLKAYPVPVFVMGTTKVLGYFKELTRNDKNILAYIEGSYEESTEEELAETLKPFLNNWKKMKAEGLRHEMEKAADDGKLATGIINVWNQVARHKGQLLIVEKNYLFTAWKSGNDEIISKPEEPYNKFSCIKDGVDDLIEKVLKDGGDVEFVDDGELKEYNHIALIQYY
ncbi:MAG: hypothetical protein JSS70_15625 [Bacteroidetes bacterium]|nr:hypothetical protein [Bacteroidota bacterium]